MVFHSGTLMPLARKAPLSSRFHRSRVGGVHIIFGDHVHNLNAGLKDAGTAKSSESQHGSRASLDRPMVLLNQVVEIFG
ncbi:MAG: hypothetical protein QOC89_3671, partial [Paraburkholderia sp.]|nr:hypothetical protein [Paraburkholderia sp.]